MVGLMISQLSANGDQLRCCDGRADQSGYYNDQRTRSNMKEISFTTYDTYVIWTFVEPITSQMCEGRELTYLQ